MKDETPSGDNVQASPPPKRGLREFIADNVIVALAMLIAKLRGFVTLPLIVSALGTAGYGTWSQILAFTTLMQAIVGFNLHLPLIRFIAQDKKEAPRIFVTLQLLSVLCAVIGGLVILPFDRGASDLLLGDPSLGRHLAVCLVIVLVSNVRLVNLNVYRAYGKFLARSGVELATSVVELAAIIVVLIQTHDIFSALVVMAAWGAIVAAITTWHAGRLTGFGGLSKSIALRGLAYAAPLLPSVLSLWILDRADRFFVGYYLGAREVGIYSASYALGQLVLQAQMPFQITLFPKVAQLWDTDREGAKRYVEMSNKFFLTLAIPFTAACAVVAPKLLVKLGNEEISANSALLTVLVSAGVTLYGVSVMQIQILHGAKRTLTQGLVSAGSAALNVALNVILLPRVGTAGAALATLIAYGATAAAMGVLAHRQLPISYFPAYLLKCVIAAAVMIPPMGTLARHGLPGLAGAIVAGSAVYFVALWLLRSFSAEEIDFAKRAVRKLRGRAAAAR